MHIGLVDHKKEVIQKQKWPIFIFFAIIKWIYYIFFDSHHYYRYSCYIISKLCLWGVEYNSYFRIYFLLKKFSIYTQIYINLQHPQGCYMNMLNLKSKEYFQITQNLLIKRWNMFGRNRIPLRLWKNWMGQKKLKLILKFITLK